MFRAGIVAVLGRPNVGKSTLVNAVVRSRVAITSPLPQTTRGRIFGVRTTQDYQIAFVDTPGFHKARNALGKAMVHAIQEESRGSDVNLLLVDLTVPPTQEDKRIAQYLFRNSEQPRLLVGNKSDLLPTKAAEERMTQYRSLGEFASTYLVSAAIGSGLVPLEADLAEMLPEGPMLFPADMQTDQDERVRASEIIREKVLLETHQEVPHAIAVDIEEYREGKTPGTTYIHATIYVEKESQKGIVIGKGGARLKKIGSLARIDLQHLLDGKVFVELRVKVKADWRQRPDVLRAWGFNV